MAEPVNKNYQYFKHDFGAYFCLLCELIVLVVTLIASSCEVLFMGDPVQIKNPDIMPQLQTVC